MRYGSKINTKITLGVALIFIVIAFFISGFLGLYSIKNSYIETSGFIEAVDIARKSESFFRNQFYIWKITILQGDEFRDYKRNYHAFTFFADRVQDSLFNLKMLCKDIRGIPEEIDNLKQMHMKITREYIVLILKSVDSKFKNRVEIFAQSKGKENSALLKMDDIVNRIEQEAEIAVTQINDYYFNLALVSFIFIAAIVVIMGIYFSFKLLGVHNELEKRVKERTDALSSANDELKKEIRVRIKAVELLQKAKEEAEEAKRKISISEKKYRLLVEESNDIIFSLDEDFYFISASRAISDYLKISPLTAKTMTFLDLLYDGSNGRTAAKQLIRENLEIFSRERKPIQFIAEFNSSFASEPREMHVRMEYINAEGRSEIHGIAAPVSEDILLKYFVSERQRLAIGNYLINIDDIARRMTQNLGKYIDAQEVSFIRIGLREMILNAIEHGNLEITYQEKSKALENDTFLQLIEERRNRPGFSKRKVDIEFQVDSRMAIYRITDQGKGFDHRIFLEGNISSRNSESIPNGRGILMTREIFNEIKYNDKGNQVLLVKCFPGHAGAVSIRTQAASMAVS